MKMNKYFKDDVKVLNTIVKEIEKMAFNMDEVREMMQCTDPKRLRKESNRVEILAQYFQQISYTLYCMADEIEDENEN